MTRLDADSRGAGRILHTFWVFLRLGVTSFGGPTAHLGYFREAFVQRRRWLTDRNYADLVALCQFLPGPASSQVGMAIGLQRAGIPGLIAAWVGFTLPSAVLLVAFAYGVTSFGDAVGWGWLVGLKAAAVAVVAHALLGMAKSLTPDAKRAAMASLTMIAVLLAPGVITQVTAIVIAGVVGLLWIRPQPGAEESPKLGVALPKWVGVAALSLFVALLVLLPVAARVTGNGAVSLIDLMYRAGALVFGGGHVVLPLLQAETVGTGLVDQDLFLAGYGAAQAVPGPLFTFAAFLGAVTTSGPTGILGASIALLAIFLPSALLVLGILPFWDRIREAKQAGRILAGVNAAVVGLLAAALVDPVILEGVTGLGTATLAFVAWLALTVWKTPAWAIVLACAGVGQLLL